ncbi:HET-domain-containing protein [Xylariaceae sp. FL1651]|nr:HET-domain-containing protein [Xylariaceae sp. FL1651]
MAVFKHQPLDIADRQIRLLDLIPDSGRVRCRLRHVSLAKLPDEYETLSYCWGAQTTRQVKISIDGLDFPIAKNLHAALLRLRHLDYDRPKTLWIDAICINQSDPVEKSNQISLMGDIYSLCRRVIIWIGEHDALTEYTFRALAFMAARSKTGEKFNYYDWKQVQQNEARNGPRQLSHKPANIKSMIAGAAFSALFSRPWFRRVWVIQEIALPPDAVVICGKFQIDWDSIAKAQGIAKTNFDVNNHLGTILRFRDWPEDLADDIFSRMMMASHQEATKPRDKIYGLLGIDYPHYDPTFVKIDYEIDDMQIFANFTRAYLERTGNLQVLAICRGCKNRDGSQEYYPSWAVDPFYEAEKEPLASDQISWRFINWEACPEGFRAGGSIPCKLSFIGNSLGIQGFQFDSVLACSPVNSPGAPQYKVKSVSAGGPFWGSLAAFYSIYLKGGISSWYSALSFCQFYLASQKMCEDTRLGGIYLPTGQTTLNAFWQVIRGPNLPIDHPNAKASAKKQFEDFGEMLRRHAGGSIGVKSIPSIIGAILGNSTYMELFPLVHMTRHRRFFITENRYMGLGPRDTKVGDNIMILQGHQAPILARATEGKHWKIVGDSYMHGIMEGSVFDQEKCELLWFD